MTTYVLLEIDDDTEAVRLVEDAANYPDNPILTPCQENTVSAKIVYVGVDLRAMISELKAERDAATDYANKVTGYDRWASQDDPSPLLKDDKA